jgi:hypothetical protein
MPFRRVADRLCGVGPAHATPPSTFSCSLVPPNSSRLTRAGYALKYSSRDSEPRPASRAAAKLGGGSLARHTHAAACTLLTILNTAKAASDPVQQSRILGSHFPPNRIKSFELKPRRVLTGSARPESCVVRLQDVAGELEQHSAIVNMRSHERPIEVFHSWFRDNTLYVTDPARLSRRIADQGEKIGEIQGKASIVSVVGDSYGWHGD